MRSSGKRSSEGSLTGCVFAITGTLSEPRAKFEEFIIQHGGEVVKSVTNTCTHLVSAESGTKKCEDALAKGVVIVDEQWVRNKVEGIASAVMDLSAAVAATAVAKTTAAAPANQLTASTLPKSTGATAKPLRGMVICITVAASSAAPAPPLVPDVLAPGVWIPPAVTATACQPSRPSRVLPSSLVSAAPAKGKSSSSGAVATNKKTATKAAPTQASSDAPLAGMVICITGTLSVSRAAFEKLITQHGGKNVKAITKDCTHLVAAEGEADEPTISPADWRRIRAMARRGDLLENVASAGYRSTGIRVFDGKRIIDLDYDVDDYGQLPPDFVVYGEFNPHYWDYATMNVNNTLVPEVAGAQSYWHTGNYPSVTIDDV
eukprot:gene3423-2532_t